MLGIITLLIALGARIGFLIYQMATKSRQTKVKHSIRIVAFILFSLLLVTGVYWWGFRWMGLFILLAIMAIFSAIYFIRRPKAQKPYKTWPAILACVSGCIVLTFCTLPGILFPQFKPVEQTGPFAVETVSYTYIDDTRIDPFSETGENRKLSVQYWYPSNEGNAQTFPLVVFSHGAFGYRGSNLSLFEELASNGYVVCSIDHTYQAFFAKHADGSSTLVDIEFLNDSINAQNGVYDAQRTFELTHEWMDVRTNDMHFVLDEILRNTNKDTPELVYSLMDTRKIGLTGHSLGGATAAQLGRERSDVDAVIVIDGTMIGEELAFENGQEVLNTEPYPVPLLNMYNQSHYEDALALGAAYSNLNASTHALEAYDAVIRGSGHLNFTDLPLFSPALARLLGTGEVDSRYCVQTVNQIVLEFFNYTLKDAQELHLETMY